MKTAPIEETTDVEYVARRGTDLGVMTAFRIVTIVAGALTPFVVIVLFVARLMITNESADQERRMRATFVERNEFNTWKSDVARQLDEIKKGQEQVQRTLNDILLAMPRTNGGPR